MEDKGYFEIGMQLINKENEHYEDAKNNWNDLREEELRVEDPVFWCYGAAGIGLSRVMIKEKLAHDEVVIDEDIQKSLDKIKMSGFDKELNHSICHGSIGNIDILLNMSDKLNDKELKDYSIKKGKEVINNIYENGIRDGLDINGNIISFMLGISGVGYTLIRLMNSYYPSVLSLDVIRKENYNEFNI